MLCGFFLALAGHQQGLQTEALRCFERTRSGCGTSGLFTEEYDVAQRQLRPTSRRRSCTRRCWRPRPG